MAEGRRVLLTGATLVLVCVGAAGLPVASAWAAGCPNESLRAMGPEDPATHGSYSAALPDCRAYEQVSPVDKNLSDALGPAGDVQSSPSGEGVTYLSLMPFPGVPGADEYVTYLATRGAGGWSTEGLLPAMDPGSFSGILALTEDTSDTILEAEGEPLLAAGAVPGVENFYVRDNATGSYRLLAAGPGHVYFDDATRDDSRLLFEDTAEKLIPGVKNESKGKVPYLYEWDDGVLSLVGVLSGGEAPAKGAVAGPGGPALEEAHEPGGGTSEFYTEDTVSEDGSRVFFSDAGTGRIYMREPDADRTVPVSAGEAYWRAATPSGSFVFYTEGEDLYRFNVGRFEASAAPEEAREPLTSGEAGVLGTLGVSDGGSYVYFVARGVLCVSCEAKEAPDEANLYEWHDGFTTFITELAAGESGTPSDSADWRGYWKSEPGGPAHGFKASRVTPDGRTVLFAKGGALELYSVADGLTTLAHDAYLQHENPPTISSAAPAGPVHLSRNLSEDGERVFFQSPEPPEPLVHQDKNAPAENVYEWEREGEGTCESTSEGFTASTGGCYYLISSGQSEDPSYFGEASADGDDVFFFTRQSLVGQDTDENEDVYDARVDGGIAAQNPAPANARCENEEACRGAAGSPPVFGAPATVTFSGPGNLTQVKPKPKPSTRAQQLTRALKACRKLKNRRKRKECERAARKTYGAKQKDGGKTKKSGRGDG